jgi:hypothetical protein
LSKPGKSLVLPLAACIPLPQDNHFACCCFAPWTRRLPNSDPRWRPFYSLLILSSLQKNVLEELYPLKEYYLHGQPQSLKAFFNLFLLPSGLPDFDRIVWMENWPTFVIISDEDDASDRMPEDYEARVTL